MRFLHEKFIIHRDMKLENIFVTEDDQIKIADLGYAAQTASLADSILGTFAYQAP
jgi:serine/threonine protein kinase